VAVFKLILRYGFFIAKKHVGSPLERLRGDKKWKKEK
jgi:hypothetical protein